MSDAAPTRRVAVIGGGWSGLAAAVELADAGVRVDLFDAAPQLGGRARRVDVRLGDRSYPLDNGQHLLIGAYRETLALMARVGLDPGALFIRQPFALRYPDGFRLQAAALPAPLHLAAALLTARGLPWSARWTMVSTVERWKRQRWTVPMDHEAHRLVADHPPVLIERLWEPLCVAALNVRLREASARVFLTVLRDSLGAGRADSDLLLPRCDLSALLPDAAARYLADRPARTQLRTLIQGVDRLSDRWLISSRDGPLGDDAFDAVVLAVPPDRCADVLAPHTTAWPGLAPVLGQLQSVATAPIATVYLRYPESTSLPFPVMALNERPAVGDLGQWVFDRAALDPRCAGVLSVVISASGGYQALGQAQVAAQVARQLSRELALPPPIAARTVEDKRATIVPVPGLLRPPIALPAPGLFLASDAADSPYPSTIEGSVRSGLAAAQAVLTYVGQG